MDLVVDGFIRLQQFHCNEVARGLSGLGTYVLRAGFPVCDLMPHQLAFAQQPADIVPTLQEPSAEVSHKHSLSFG